ncbi:hypothetical protein PR202_gb03027 [Eleusine coracana subsp. coracana]|uniref:Uncharacterized protein n=1 Tax=Eleusine coracana subsp. coracana TaxID=191504 RepID=A0AAV5E0T1_ELECO|nr:hypothetical protein PR202_gb03027 [Eleusine coracana subsp. coracana]
MAVPAVVVVVVVVMDQDLKSHDEALALAGTARRAPPAAAPTRPTRWFTAAAPPSSPRWKMLCLLGSMAAEEWGRGGGWRALTSLLLRTCSAMEATNCVGWRVEKGRGVMGI